MKDEEVVDGPPRSAPAAAIVATPGTFDADEDEIVDEGRNIGDSVAKAEDDDDDDAWWRALLCCLLLLAAAA